MTHYCKHEQYHVFPMSRYAWCQMCGASAGLDDQHRPVNWRVPSRKDSSEGSIVINSNGIKRRINGPYAVCGSRETLQRLCAALKAALDETFDYGWVDVVEPVKVLPDTPPKDWESDA